MDFMMLAETIRRLRQEKKISQQLMAKHLGISRATLNAFENQRSPDIGLRKVMMMLDYLGFELRLREKSPFPTFEELRDALLSEIQDRDVD